MAELKVVASPADRSPAASTALPLLYMALGDNYDRAKKSYKGNYTDEQIAKETGLSVEFVKQRREADFGPLVPQININGLLVEFVCQNTNLQTAFRDMMSGKVEDLARNLRALETPIRMIDAAANKAKNIKV